MAVQTGNDRSSSASRLHLVRTTGACHGSKSGLMFLIYEYLYESGFRQRPLLAVRSTGSVGAGLHLKWWRLVLNKWKLEDPVSLVCLLEFRFPGLESCVNIKPLAEQLDELRCTQVFIDSYTFLTSKHTVCCTTFNIYCYLHLFRLLQWCCVIVLLLFFSQQVTKEICFLFLVSSLTVPLPVFLPLPFFSLSYPPLTSVPSVITWNEINK